MSAVETAMTGPHAFVSSGGTALPLRQWGPDDARIVFVAVHGLNDYSGAFRQPAEVWGRSGVRTYAYDQCGFGALRHIAVADPQTMSDDLVSLLTQVRQWHPRARLYLVGESMGGAVAAMAAATGGAELLDGLVLAAPAIRPKEHIPAYQRALGWLAWRVVPGLQVYTDPLKSKATDNAQVLREMAQDPLYSDSVRLGTLLAVGRIMDVAADRLLDLNLPVLVLWGANDRVLPVGTSDTVTARLAGAAVGARSIVYHNGHHLLFRDRHANRPTRDVLQWAVLGDSGEAGDAAPI